MLKLRNPRNIWPSKKEHPMVPRNLFFFLRLLPRCLFKATFTHSHYCVSSQVNNSVYICLHKPPSMIKLSVLLNDSKIQLLQKEQQYHDVFHHVLKESTLTSLRFHPFFLVYTTSSDVFQAFIFNVST